MKIFYFIYLLRLYDILSNLYLENERYSMLISVDEKMMVFGRKIEENDAAIYMNGLVMQIVEFYISRQ